MTVLGNMRRRITLMREENIQGAGGRMIKATPVIGDVWATIEESAGSAQERADKQIFGGSARFTTRYSKQYLLVRQIEWRGVRYRVTGTDISRGGTPTLTFAARVMEEGSQ